MSWKNVKPNLSALLTRQALPRLRKLLSNQAYKEGYQDGYEDAIKVTSDHYHKGYYDGRKDALKAIIQGCRSGQISNSAEFGESSDAPGIASITQSTIPTDSEGAEA